MDLLKKIVGGLLGLLAALFSVTFVIYFFNLDMRVVALIEPLLQELYDSKPRNQSL